MALAGVLAGLPIATSSTIAARPGAPLLRGVDAPGIAAADRLTPDDPPDVTGAIGLHDYVETVNAAVAVYSRRLRLRAVQKASSFWGVKDLVDPQIAWDSQARRWYYLTLDAQVAGDAPSALLLAWSKGPDPTDLRDGWCRLRIGTGKIVDDYPKLGFDRRHIVIGTNTLNFTDPNFKKFSRIWAVGKPRDGQTSCKRPPVSSFGSAAEPLRRTDGRRAFTPVPVTPVEPSGRAYVVAADCVHEDSPGENEEGCSRPQGRANQITVWHITGPRAAPRLVMDGGVDVPPYRGPKPVPQRGTNRVLDALDGRLTQAVSNADPGRSGAEAIWTQHTVEGPGGRSEVRWYELDPRALALLRTGAIAKRRAWVFNGAVSPTTRGDRAAIQYSLSGRRLLPQIRARALGLGNSGSAKRGEITLGRSAAAASSCQGPPDVCRWGDYAAATPDPRRSGVVWGSNELIGPPLGPGIEHWRTRNFALRLPTP